MNYTPTQPAFPDSQPVSVTLPAGQWNVVLAGLFELPYKLSAQVIADVRGQAMSQLEMPAAPGFGHNSRGSEVFANNSQAFVNNDDG